MSTKVVSIAEGKIACEAGGKPLEVPFDKALVSIGRRANIKGIGLENLGVVTDRAGIVTDKMRTSVENVYATGDVTGRYMLAHTAYRESEVAINTILGKADRMRYNANPSVIYTQPEVASVGLSEEAAKDAGIDYEVKSSPCATRAASWRKTRAAMAFAKSSWIKTPQHPGRSYAGFLFQRNHLGRGRDD